MTTDPEPDSNLPIPPRHPVVERRHHVDRGVAAIEAGPGVVICGGIGVGKTHLAHQVGRSVAAGRELVALSATATGGHAALERLVTTSDGQVLVQVDDAHLLDEASADLLAGWCRAGRIGLLLTTNDDVSAPAAITGLWRDHVAERIDLGPFTVAEVAVYLEQALDAVVTAELINPVWTATLGNPMLLAEAVRGGLESGALTPTGAGWRWEGSVRPSARLLQLVRDDLGRMDADQRDLIHAIALGGSISLERLHRLGSGATLDRLVDLGLVVVEARHAEGDHTPRARARHLLLADAVSDLVGPARRQMLFRRVFGAEGLGPETAAGEPPAELVRLAFWALDSGAAIDGGALVAAARAAVAVDDHARSVVLASAALESLAPSDPRRVDALVAGATSRRFLHQPEQARREVDEALDLLRQAAATGEVPRLSHWVEVAELSADLHQYAGDDPTMAQAVLDESLAVVDAHPHLDPDGRFRGALTAGRMTRSGWAGLHLESSDLGLDLLSDGSSTPEDRLRVAAPTAMGLALRGQLDRALAITTRHLAEPPEVLASSPGTFSSLVSAHHVVLAWRGDLDRLTEFLDSLDEVDGPHPKVHAGMQMHRRGLLALSRGQRSEGLDLLTSAARRFEDDDPHGMRASALGYAALASATLGDDAGARALRDEARATPLRGIRVAGADLEMVLGMVSVWLGEPDALEPLLDLADRCAKEGLLLTRLIVLYSVAATAWFVHGDVDLVVDVLEPVEEVAAQVDGELAALRCAQVRAMADGDDATVQQLVSALAGRGVWPPVAPARVVLSPRQREVATLAAQGLSSRDIADKLFVSVRTVDTHLSHVFAKLGIHSRTDLTEALRSRT